MSRENPTQEELSIAAKSLGIQVDKINDVKKIMDTLNMTLGADADHAIEALLALNINLIQAVELVLEQMKVNQDGLRRQTSAMMISAMIKRVIEGE
ncbi:hypothetical protein LCGC14_2419530, partial [marine sediment metagenome]